MRRCIQRSTVIHQGGGTAGRSGLLSPCHRTNSAAKHSLPLRHGVRERGHDQDHMRDRTRGLPDLLSTYLPPVVMRQ